VKDKLKKKMRDDVGDRQQGPRLEREVSDIRG